MFKTFIATFILIRYFKILQFSEPLEDILLAAIFGGAINGIAIGIVFLCWWFYWWNGHYC